MDKPAIKLSKATKKYNIYKKNIQRIMGIVFGREAAEVRYGIRNVDLEIMQGEKVAVLGTGEAGVTTLLKVISGITFLSGGKVTTNGSINCFLSRKAGMDNEFSCRDNIYMKANIVGIPKKVIAEHEDEILEFAEVAQFADLPLKRAPKGSDLRIALAVHLMAKSDILIIDEKLSLGGTVSKKKCEDKIVQYVNDNNNITLLITNVKKKFAKQICNRGIILHKGKVVFDGPFIEAYDLFKKEYRRAEKKKAANKVIAE